jgi:hypothetical protein
MNAALPALILAAIVPIGPELRVNTYTTGAQQSVSVARLNDEFLVTWHDIEQDGVFARKILTTGQFAGSPFRVSTGGDGPSASSDAYEDYVVAWADGGGAYFSRKDDVAAVRADTQGAVVSVDVASTPGGEFVIAWYDSVRQDVFARRFTGFGVPRSPEFRVSTAGGSHNSPSVSADRAGRFVVAWRDGSTPMFRRFARDGAPLGDQVVVSEEEAGTVDVDHAPDGGFLVAWGASDRLHARAFDTNGSPRAGTQELDDAFASVGGTSVTTLGDGYLVVWQALNVSGQFDVFLRRATLDGEPQGDLFRVNTYATGSQLEPSVAKRFTRVLVAWQSFGQDGSSQGIYAQMYDVGPTRGDTNGDGIVNVLDVFSLINFLFAGGPAPHF